MKYLALLLFAAAASAQSTIQVVGGHSRPEIRITNGTLANIENFPWQVGLIIEHNDGSPGTKCGGALLTDDLVLTAAHCLENVWQVTVCVGTSIFCSGVRVPVTRWIIHAGYIKAGYHNDVALVKLAFRVPLGNTIKTIDLPSANVDTVADECLYVSGFGETLSGLTNDLNYISVKSISNADCRNIFPDLDLNQMCVIRGQQKSVCRGDSGGALVKLTPKGPVHVGIASFVSLNGCDKNLPSGFARTSKYVNWILENAPKLYP